MKMMCAVRLRLHGVLVEYAPTFCCVNEIVLRSQFPSFTLLQHPPMHISSCCYAFGRPGAAFMGGSLEKFRKEAGQTNTDRQLMLMAPPIRVFAPMPLIGFFEGT